MDDVRVALEELKEESESRRLPEVATAPARHDLAAGGRAHHCPGAVGHRAVAHDKAHHGVSCAGNHVRHRPCSVLRSTYCSHSALAGGRRSARLRHGGAEVLERTNGTVRLWPSTLYGSLKRLISDGLIEESDERPARELDDARRRYYRLTRLGRTVLDLECERLQAMVRMVQRKRKQEAY